MTSVTENERIRFKSMKQLNYEYRWMQQNDDFEDTYEFRCCFECYHFAEFIGYDHPICEKTLKGIRNPFAYTDCDDFRVYDGVDGTVHRWPKKEVGV